MPKAKQPSRKGKAAWRKNIDIDAIEKTLEKQRVAERIGPETSFIEDRQGDRGIASASSKPKRGLKSLEVLNQTGPPGLTSRAKRSASNGLTPEQRAMRAGMSRKDIEKLRRSAGKDVKGAFGVIVEEDEPKKRGVEAIIVPGTYDVWTNGVASAQPQLPPSFKHAKKSTSLDLPKPGQSYNPAAEDHEMLLNQAIKDLQDEEEQRQKQVEWKKAWDAGAKQARGEDGFEDLVGLKVGRGEIAENEAEEDDADEDESDGEVKEIKRKTKQQKAKAKKIKEEIRARLEAKANKRSMSELQSIKLFKKQLLATEGSIKEMAEKRRLVKEKKMQDRVGVYKLPKMQDEVQLGEDLAEGLRTLKPEGNPLKDRALSFQKHGIVEPKQRDIIGKRKGGSMRGKKEYEAHAYKRFS